MRAQRLARAVAKGYLYRFYFGSTGKRFTVGRNFRCFGSIVFRGPGRLTLGNDVVLLGRVTPFTHARAAHIHIGDNVRLDGVRFGCAESISIGRDSMLAECHIIDTDFHSTRVDRRTNLDAPVRTAPIVIEENVWISEGVAILAGASIGANSVVGIRAVCVRRYPPNSILFGNPAAVVAPVPQVPGAQSEGGTAAPVPAT
jgi:acetyltransferase-like isoleucine patch superfamily enzyme